QELSFELPKGYVKGKVGAGDAFCAGVLLAAHNNLDLAQALHYGNASGVCSLGQTGATENLRPLHEVIELYSQLEKSNPQ
ncbi:MAG: PfkB family carbohydrate kinase, partial [Sphaerochaetaceae bacterium]